MLTFKSLIQATTDAREKKAMLAQKVEDMLNTVVRQIAFYSFERVVHEERKAGELTSERLGQIWLQVQAESLGPAIELQQGYETFWSYVPHFIHSPFYVYAYAFGDCLVNSLYGLFLDAHPGFVAKYFAMLEAGGSKHHSELLAPFGLNASDPAFWKKGLRGYRGHDRRARGRGSQHSATAIKRRSGEATGDHYDPQVPAALVGTNHASTNFPGGPFAAAKRGV